MRVIINRNNGFTTVAELRRCEAPKETFSLRFLTVWDKAKNPDDEQVKTEIFLTRPQLSHLQKFIDTYLEEN